jgi:hypothetical protein
MVHCIVLGLVTDFGIEKLQKYGMVDANLEFGQVSSKPMSAADAALFTDIGFTCGDFEADVAAFIRGENGPMSDSEVERCVQAVTEDDVRRASEGFLQEDPTADPALGPPCWSDCRSEFVEYGAVLSVDALSLLDFGRRQHRDIECLS